MKFARLGFILSACVALTSEVNAQRASANGTSTDRYVSQGWHVGRYGGPATDRIVARQQTIFEQPLIADRLLKIDTDATDGTTGERIAGAGEILFVTHSKIGLVACGIKGVRPLGHINSRYCFRDADGDGKFDDFGHYLAPNEAMPVVNDSYPKKPKLLARTVPYSQGTLVPDHSFSIRLIFNGGTIYGKSMLDFNVEVGGSDRFVVVDHARVRRPEQPLDLEIAGSTVHIEVIDYKTLRARVVSPFAEEPIVLFYSAGKFI